MENQDNERINYDFLSEDDVQKSFADLHSCLLSGKHICIDDYTLFSLLEKYEKKWKFIYRSLYGMNLVETIFDRQAYFYLDFFDFDKGKLGDPSRSHQLTEIQTITGLVLLDIYYHQYFDEKKVIYWADIQNQIKDGEYHEQYKKLLFGVIRDSYSEQEWLNVEKKFRNTINSFNRFGWVSVMPEQGKDLVFEIKPAIFRLSKLYEVELSDFDNFATRLTNNN